MAGLAVDRQGPAKPASPSVVRIMNFTDPSHPKIAREFQGVTAITRDIRRRLIFLADSEGIWILREHLAEDPEIVQEYSDYVQYGLGGGFRAGHEAAVVGPLRQGHPMAEDARTKTCSSDGCKDSPQGAIVDPLFLR